MYFDAHCHLTDPRFAGETAEVLARALEAGVRRVVTIASDVTDAEAALALANAHTGVWSTAGVHPHAADSADAAAFARIAELAREPRVVALGETGLDYHYDNAPRPVQRVVFDRHLELASAVGLPVVVHCREADDDVAAAIRNAPGVRGVLHCFSGERALLDVALEAGWFVSFAGMVTFKNYGGADLVRAVPGDRIMVETDSPYLAPVPHRGRRNEPGYVPLVVAALARLRDEPVERLAEQTTDNAIRFYALQPEPPKS